MILRLSLLGTEIISVEWKHPDPPEPHRGIEAGSGVHLDFGFAGTRPVWSPLEHDDRGCP